MQYDIIETNYSSLQIYMPLEKILDTIRKNLENDAYPNEQAISQSIVLPVLQSLSWDIFQTNTVHPEYKTSRGRADFALCSPPGRPRCLIEVKQPGGIKSDAIEQLMNYAFAEGAQFAVLTDGQTWSFYLPAEPGTYEERRVFMLDLFEHGSDKASDILQRYLLEQDVVSGAVVGRARSDLHDRHRRVKAKEAIPAAWKNLVEELDDQQSSILIESLANECESKKGIRPENADVINFLKGLNSTKGDLSAGSIKKPVAVSAKTPTSVKKPSKISYRLHGHECTCKTMKEAFVGIFTELAHNDPHFAQRCAADAAFYGRTRQYIGRSREELYPNHPELQSQVGELPGGWWINTNSDNAHKISLLKHACRIAGIKFGNDLKIRIPN